MNNTTKKILISSIFALTLTGSLAGASWWWEEQKGKKLSAEMQSIRDQDQMERGLKDLEKEWKKAAPLHDYLSALVIDGDKDTIELLSVMDNIAESKGVALTTGNLNVKKLEDDEWFNKLEVSVTLRGERAAVLTVVKQFEQLPYAASVERLTFMRSGSDATANLSLLVSIKK